MITEYFIEGSRVIVDRSFDIVSDIRSNDIIELLRPYNLIYYCLTMV
jgi:hypothetical protein